MHSTESFPATGSKLTDQRLVGWNPSLYIRDAGLPHDAGPSHPAVLRSELQLVAGDHSGASLRSTSYFVDKTLIALLRPRDTLHMTRDPTGGIGLSALRGNQLLYAVGEVTAVPLGAQISVKIPFDLVKEVDAAFRRRDPEFELLEHPIEVRIGDTSRILFNGAFDLNGYHVRVQHGFILGMPGTAECASISLNSSCDWVCAFASAQLLARG